MCPPWTGMPPDHEGEEASVPCPPGGAQTMSARRRSDHACQEASRPCPPEEVCRPCPLARVVLVVLVVFFLSLFRFCCLRVRSLPQQPCGGTLLCPGEHQPHREGCVSCFVFFAFLWFRAAGILFNALPAESEILLETAAVLLNSKKKWFEAQAE